MIPFGVTIPATVPQRSDIPERLMNYPVFGEFTNFSKTPAHHIYRNPPNGFVAYSLMQGRKVKRIECKTRYATDNHLLRNNRR
jgi:hypothetical protein